MRTARGSAAVVRVLVAGEKIVQSNFVSLSSTLVDACLIVDRLVYVGDVIQTAELVGASLCALTPPASRETKFIVRTWPTAVTVGRIARTDARNLLICFD